jgi:FixJ family two-component response regulator
MKISVFDKDVEALANWRRLSTTNSLQFAGHTDLDKFQTSLADDTQIIVLDQSLVQGEISRMIIACCQNYRQHLFVATASHLSVQQTVQMMRHSAAWAFEKPLSQVQVQPALITILEIAQTVADSLDEYRRLQNNFDRLTDREKQVLNLILDGTANKEAAAELNISVRTVEARRAKVYHKTATDNLAGLMRKVELLERYHRQFTPLRHVQSGLPDHHLKFAESAGLNESGSSDPRNCSSH